MGDVVKTVCKTPECGKLASTRGLCTSCFTQATRAVKSGETTWEDLERLGMVDPLKRKSVGDFTKWLRSTPGDTNGQVQENVIPTVALTQPSVSGGAERS